MLRELRIQYLDLLLIHWPVALVPTTVLTLTLTLPTSPCPPHPQPTCELDHEPAREPDSDPACEPRPLLSIYPPNSGPLYSDGTPFCAMFQSMESVAHGLSGALRPNNNTQRILSPHPYSTSLVLSPRMFSSDESSKLTQEVEGEMMSIPHRQGCARLQQNAAIYPKQWNMACPSSSFDAASSSTFITYVMSEQQHHDSK